MRSATQGEKAALVKELREERYRLNDLLDAIGLSRSTYYYELSKTDKVKERNADLSSEIVAIFNENRKRYGVRRVHHELLNRGFCVNHKRVQRIMNRLSLAGKRPKEKYHSYKGDVGKVADNIIKRDFSTENPLQKWTTDVSQFNLSWGKCYISPILDMNTNEIISYNLSLSPNMEQIRDMLQKAFKRFPSVQGLIMHSDQGWQYQHAFYRKELEKHGIVQSMSRKGNCYVELSRKVESESARMIRLWRIAALSTTLHPASAESRAALAVAEPYTLDTAEARCYPISGGVGHGSLQILPAVHQRRKSVIDGCDPP